MLDRLTARTNQRYRFALRRSEPCVLHKLHGILGWLTYSPSPDRRETLPEIKPPYSLIAESVRIRPSSTFCCKPLFFGQAECLPRHRHLSVASPCRHCRLTDRNRPILFMRRRSWPVFQIGRSSNKLDASWFCAEFSIDKANLIGMPVPSVC